jgi:hypothetical protein
MSQRVLSLPILKLTFSENWGMLSVLATAGNDGDWPALKRSWGKVIVGIALPGLDCRNATGIVSVVVDSRQLVQQLTRSYGLNNCRTSAEHTSRLVLSTLHSFSISDVQCGFVLGLQIRQQSAPRVGSTLGAHSERRCSTD